MTVSVAILPFDGTPVTVAPGARCELRAHPSEFFRPQRLSLPRDYGRSLVCLGLWIDRGDEWLPWLEGRAQLDQVPRLLAMRGGWPALAPGDSLILQVWNVGAEPIENFAPAFCGEREPS